MKPNFTFLFSLLLFGAKSFAQAPPANDDYPAAGTITVNPGYAATSVTQGSTVAATESATAFCNNLQDYNGDVWYKFVATKSNQVVQWTDVANATDALLPQLAYEVFRTSNGNPTDRLFCQNTYGYSSSFIFSGLVPGETLLMRVYSGSVAHRINFKVNILTPADAPVNDEPAGALVLQPNAQADCANKISGTTLGATWSSAVAANYAYADVWYKFTATKQFQSISVSNFQGLHGNANVLFLSVYTGNLAEFGSRIISNSVASSLMLTNLTVGTVYYVQAHSSGQSFGAANFDICLNDIPAPVYDEYTTALSVPVLETSYCSASTPIYTISATQSAQESCGTGADDDIWLKFTARQSVQSFLFSEATRVNGIFPGLRMEVFKNVNDTPGERVFCGDLALETGVATNITNLQANQAYFIRFYTIGTDVRTSFSLCIYSPNKPANDEFANATQLTPNTGINCVNTVLGTTNGSSLSPVESCTELNLADIWYTFTAQKVSQVVRLHNLSGGGGGSYYAKAHIEVFTKNNNSPGTRIFCGDYQTFTTSTFDAALTDLTVGANYYIRVYASGVNRPSINFNICILPADPPVNDNPAGAIALSINTIETCPAGSPYTTLGATTTASVAACQSGANDDVWFTFVATHTAHVIAVTNVNRVTGYTGDRVAEVFTSLNNAPDTRIFCPPLAFTSTTLTGLTIGHTYFLRVYTRDLNDRINFNVCVSPLPKPANDECANAIDISNGVQSVGDIETATQSMVAGACASGTVADVWYKFTAKVTGEMNVQASTVDFDLVLEGYSGECGSLTSFFCKNDAVGTELFSVQNVVAGTTYYFRVYGTGTSNGRISAGAGAFAIQVYGGALPVTLTSFKVLQGENKSASLEWTTTHESNSSHFDVEHSLNAKDWTSIGSVEAAASASELLRYHFTHPNPSPGQNYYRLKSVDLDATYSLSAIRNLHFESAALARAFPNPAAERILIDVQEKSVKRVTLTTIGGTSVLSQAGQNIKEVHVKQIPTGVYILRLDYSDGSRFNQKILIQK